MFCGPKSCFSCVFRGFSSPGTLPEWSWTISGKTSFADFLLSFVGFFGGSPEFHRFFNEKLYLKIFLWNFIILKRSYFYGKLLFFDKISATSSVSKFHDEIRARGPKRPSGSRVLFVTSEIDSFVQKVIIKNCPLAESLFYKWGGLFYKCEAFFINEARFL